jgi:hypothetical protein
VALALALGAMATFVAGALFSISTDRSVALLGGIVGACGVVILVLGAVIWFSAGQLAD